ncbi:MAG: hypothetical protein K0T00_1442, partial [Gaiellaceae bacterium]|nr:hypothetical protein [Gaiellaceae bacterium]
MQRKRWHGIVVLATAVAVLAGAA